MEKLLDVKLSDGDTIIKKHHHRGAVVLIVACLFIAIGILYYSDSVTKKASVQPVSEEQIRSSIAAQFSNATSTEVTEEIKSSIASQFKEASSSLLTDEQRESIRNQFNNVNN